MTIKEIWVPVDDEEDAELITWIPMHVITMVKLNYSQVLPDGSKQSQDMQYILCFHKETGETAEVPFTTCYIKEIEDAKTKKTISVSPPQRKKGSKN